MAKVSKARPWAVEIQPPGVADDQWFAMDAYRDMETAVVNEELMRRRSPDAKFRTRLIES